ncbi:hypothetical protein [Actinotalea subterranea]|uniref:hypothetical protein n=1 Tax=Actinotalea subterranea TaxID=2607497 RepID=UPI0011EE9DD5|nr:hypothetical protein [Actinotalea subterranea]
MRWDALFADMEMQLAAASAQDVALEVADRTRTERASVLLADRLRAARGEVVLTLRSGVVAGRVVDVGPAWVLLVDGAREHLVPLASVVTVAGLPHAAAPQERSALRRLGLGHALRAVARDRSLVRLVTVGGAVLGRIDAVGADHLDVTPAYEDSGRPTGETRALTFAGIDVISAG